MKLKLQEQFLTSFSAIASIILIWDPKTVEAGLQATCPVIKELDSEGRALGFGNSVKKLYLVIPEHAKTPSALLYCGMVEVEWKKAGISFSGDEFQHISDCVSSESNLNVRFITSNSSVVRDTYECTDRLKCSPSSSSEHQFTIAPLNVDGSRYLSFNLDSGIPYRRLLIGIRQRALCFDIPLEKASGISPLLWILLAGIVSISMLICLFYCLPPRSQTVYQNPAPASVRTTQVDFINSLQRGCAATAAHPPGSRPIMLVRIRREFQTSRV